MNVESGVKQGCPIVPYSFQCFHFTDTTATPQSICVYSCWDKTGITDHCMTRYWHYNTILQICLWRTVNSNSIFTFTNFLRENQEMLVVWECERLCVVFQVLRFPGASLVLAILPKIYWLSCSRLPNWERLCAVFQFVPSLRLASLRTFPSFHHVV